MRHARDAEGGCESAEKVAGFFDRLIASLSGSKTEAAVSPRTPEQARGKKIWHRNKKKS